ncbi:MAG: biosynthetic arginine decarboxylase [Verrucomicrobiales bacterium]|nr:biosynthetic arginine decarboxylase [Verrucomicrobiales bacterium]
MDHYRIRDWGSGFFDVNAAGEVVAKVSDESGKVKRISLLEVVKELRRLGLSLPAIVRFPDILAARVRTINEAFGEAIEKLGYTGSYSGCFPIKVNQRREVISEVSSVSGPYQFGLEAGTKAELVAALSQLRGSESHLVCNGYKDQDFVDLALYAIKAGLKAVLVIERPSELPLILERSAKLGVEPRLGLRIRIRSNGSGRWSTTAGGQGVFGLSYLEIIRAVDLLRDKGMLHCLYLIHYHQGSQIPDLNTIRRGLEEAANLFIELTNEGAQLGAINVGGGLAIDYEGSGVISNSSMNYSLTEYCETVVEVIRDYLDANDVPHPTIITESGRAIASHYSTLVFNVLDEAMSPCSICETEVRPPGENATEDISSLFEILENLEVCNIRESVRKADEIIQKYHVRFAAGDSSLRNLATIEEYRECLTKRMGSMLADPEFPKEFIGNEIKKYYYANFSVFQSLPDAWAIGQLFPIMPIHRLNEQPTREGVITDITCDCDGKLKRYVGPKDEESTLPLHELRPGEPYYLGAFLVGAYQETLGDIHNLFGRPTVVSVRIEDGEFQFDRIQESESVSEILAQVDFEETDLFDEMTDLTDEAHQAGRISGADRKAMLQLFGDTLRSSTYLSANCNEVPSSLEQNGIESELETLKTHVQ